MKWIVGVELLPHGEGPLEWLAWLSRQGALSSRDVAAITIIEERLSMPLQGETRAQVERAAADVLHRLVRDSAAEGCVGEESVRTYASIDGALGDEASFRQATLVIGRLARRGQRRWVRLGGTARRVLRRLSTPVVVVPPDLRASDIGNGPVVCALDTRDETMSAVRFATAIARVVSRPLELVHAVPPLFHRDAEWLSAAQLADAAREHERHAGAAFFDFVQRHGLGASSSAVVVGSPVDALLDLAERERAAIVVCGSRLLGTAARMMTSSFGSELAAVSKIPVAVVPPTLEIDSV